LLGGDLILAVNGLVCEGPHDFAAVAASTTPSIHRNEPIAITVFRDGKTLTLQAGADSTGLLEMIENYSGKDDET